jgi:hypothetical protein
MRIFEASPIAVPPLDLIRGPAATIAHVRSGPRVKPEGGSAIVDGTEFEFGLRATVRGGAEE